MKIKEIIKYQWKSKENKTLQQKALKIFDLFLIVMFILTILSRFADSLLIPIVKTETSKGNDYYPAELKLKWKHNSK